MIAPRNRSPRAAGRAALAALAAGVALGLVWGPEEAESRPAVARTLSAPERDSLITALHKERALTEEWLKKEPTSYLAAVRRLDFDRATRLTVGRAADNEIGRASCRERVWIAV